MSDRIREILSQYRGKSPRVDQFIPGELNLVRQFPQTGNYSNLSGGSLYRS